MSYIVKVPGTFTYDLKNFDIINLLVSLVAGFLSFLSKSIWYVIHKIQKN